MGKESGSIAIALLGFTVLVLGFRGTWGRVWSDIWGGSPPGSGGGSSTSSSTTPTSGINPQTGNPITPQSPFGTFPVINFGQVASGTRLPTTSVSTPTGTKN